MSAVKASPRPNMQATEGGAFAKQSIEDPVSRAFQFLDGAPSLIDGRMHTGVPCRVGIGNCDSAKPPSRNFVRFRIAGFRFIKRIEGMGISMRPAVNGDRRDVALRLEAARLKHPFSPSAA